MTGVALLVAGGALVGSPAQAEAPDGTGLLRLAHLSPDTPAVDVYVDSVADPTAGVSLEGVSYGAVSDYQDVTTGTYTVSMREAGASRDTPPVLSTTVEVTGDTARTVAGVGLFADLGLTIIDDSLQTPPAGQSRIRVLGGAANAPTLDVTLPGGAAVATDLAFADTGDYVDVPAGTTMLAVSAGDQAPNQLPVDLAAGSVYSLVVLDGDAGLTVRPVLDAAGPTVVPAGGVETGAGGAAGSAAPPGIAVLAAATATAGALVLARTRRRPARHALRHR